MELYDFNRKTQEERAEFVYKYGQFLIFRVHKENKVGLYHMGKFFAEIWYGTTSNEITLVQGFKSLDLLNPYLDLVNLSEITE